MYETLLIK